MGFGQPLAGFAQSGALPTQGSGMSSSMAGVSGWHGNGWHGRWNGWHGTGRRQLLRRCDARAAASRCSRPQPDNPAAPANAGQFSIKAFRHYQAAHVALQPHNPEAAYLQDLRAAAAHHAFAVYMQLRRHFERSPDFYLECADFLLRAARDRKGDSGP